MTFRCLELKALEVEGGLGMLGVSEVRVCMLGHTLGSDLLGSGVRGLKFKDRQHERSFFLNSSIRSLSGHRGYILSDA